MDEPFGESISVNSGFPECARFPSGSQLHRIEHWDCDITTSGIHTYRVRSFLLRGWQYRWWDLAGLIGHGENAARGFSFIFFHSNWAEWIYCGSCEWSRINIISTWFSILPDTITYLLPPPLFFLISLLEINWLSKSQVENCLKWKQWKEKRDWKLNICICSCWHIYFANVLLLIFPIWFPTHSYIHSTYLQPAARCTCLRMWR